MCSSTSTDAKYSRASVRVSGAGIKSEGAHDADDASRHASEIGVFFTNSVSQIRSACCCLVSAQYSARLDRMRSKQLGDQIVIPDEFIDPPQTQFTELRRGKMRMDVEHGRRTYLLHQSRGAARQLLSSSKVSTVSSGICRPLGRPSGRSE